MVKTFHYEILDRKRKKILPKLIFLSGLDIAAMKIIALTRAAYRDYVDLYFILKNYDLDDIISLAKKRYKNFDEGIYLKCLLSYTDVEIAPIKFMPGFKKDKKEIFSYIENHVKAYLKNKLPVS